MTAAIIRFLLLAWKPLAAILAGLGLYAKGRADAKAKAELRDAQANIKTRKRIDEADIVGNDPDAARRWLHERSKSGRDL